MQYYFFKYFANKYDFNTFLNVLRDFLVRRDSRRLFTYSSTTTLAQDWIIYAQDL